jgi:RND family efflux transporter MFP subunit
VSPATKPWTARPVVRVLAVILILAGLWFVYKVWHARNQASPDYARRHGLPIPVRTAVVEMRGIEKVIGGTATTIPSERIPIRAAIHPRLSLEDGAATPAWLIVKTIHVLEGAQVHPGDLMIELDDAEQQISARRAETAAKSAEAELTAVRAAVASSAKLRDLELDAARAEVKYRTDALAAHAKIFKAMAQLSGKDVVAAVTYYEAQIKQAEAEYEEVNVKGRLQRAEDAMVIGVARDQAELARAELGHQTAQGNLEIAKRDLDFCKIKSPIDGFVSKITASPGETFAVTSSLGELVKLNPLRVQMDFPQERIDEVAVGNNAEVVLDSYPRESFSGKVVGIVPQAVAESRVVPVMIELPNPSNRIRGGLMGFARLKNALDRVTIPAVAVIQHGPQSIVFRVENGRAQLRNVILGPVLENGVLEVVSGLSPNDEVVIYGGTYLRDGERVNTDWKDWTRRE